jgi:hypothetical protein
VTSDDGTNCDAHVARGVSTAHVEQIIRPSDVPVLSRYHIDQRVRSPKTHHPPQGLGCVIGGVEVEAGATTTITAALMANGLSVARSVPALGWFGRL